MAAESPWVTANCPFCCLIWRGGTLSCPSLSKFDSCKIIGNPWCFNPLFLHTRKNIIAITASPKMAPMHPTITFVRWLGSSLLLAEFVEVCVGKTVRKNILLVVVPRSTNSSCWHFLFPVQIKLSIYILRSMHLRRSGPWWTCSEWSITSTHSYSWVHVTVGLALILSLLLTFVNGASKTWWIGCCLCLLMKLSCGNHVTWILDFVCKGIIQNNVLLCLLFS